MCRPSDRNGRFVPEPCCRGVGVGRALVEMSAKRCLAPVASVFVRLVADRRSRRARPSPRARPRAHRGCGSRRDERRRLERDLHDGVHNELVSLIVKLQLAEEHHHTPPELAGTLSALAAHAEAALDSVREIAHGIDPSSLAAFGVERVIRAQAARASMNVRLERTAPRSNQEAEAAGYFSCLETIQNAAKHAGHAAKHAGHAAHVTLQLHHEHGTLAVRIQDDEIGSDPADAETGAGLRNIRERIGTLGGTVTITSNPGHGTVVAIALPWPARQAEQTMPNATSQANKAAASND